MMRVISADSLKHSIRISIWSFSKALKLFELCCWTELPRKSSNSPLCKGGCKGGCEGGCWGIPRKLRSVCGGWFAVGCVIGWETMFRSSKPKGSSLFFAVFVICWDGSSLKLKPKGSSLANALVGCCGWEVALKILSSISFSTGWGFYASRGPSMRFPPSALLLCVRGVSWS